MADWNCKWCNAGIYLGDFTRGTAFSVEFCCQKCAHEYFDSIMPAEPEYVQPAPEEPVYSREEALRRRKERVGNGWL
jgi:hypothetical protein